MLIDGFTVVAQIINFLILLLLLRRFLYRPILKAMEEREMRVMERLEQAKQTRQQAEEELQHYQAQNQELHQQYTQKQQEAREEVEAWRKEALQTARHEVDTTVQEWRQSVTEEREAFAAGLRHFAVQQTYAIAGQALRDLADASLEERLVAIFLSRLKGGELDLKRLKKDGGDALTLRSAFRLSPALQKRIRAGLQEYLGRDLTLDYETAPDLAAGIELVEAGGHRLAWNLRRYLEALEEELDEQFRMLPDESPAVAEQAEG